MYPIDAHGVDANMGLGPDPASHQAAARFIDSEYWAELTGGKAYHVNDIDHEITDAVDHGSRYYTLAYVPSDSRKEGRERTIDVKVSGNYTLFYRRHYFERTPRDISAARSTVSDPLLPLMGHGLPNADEIPYRLKVIPALAQPRPDSPRAGQNPELSGKLTRYDVEFQLAGGGLSLPPDADGTRRRSLQVALVVYGQDFKPLNWEIRDIHLAITPENWAARQETAITFHLAVDVPSGDVYLRTGVYDSTSSKVGTLEIPLSAVIPAPD